MQEPPTGHLSDPADRQASARQWTRRFGAVLGLLAIVTAAAYVSTQPFGDPPASLPTFDAGDAIGHVARGVGIGEAAPDFVAADGTEPLLLDLDGNPIRLHDFAGKPLWIVFWATWCTPCQQEAPDIRDLYRAHRDDDLEVLAIDIQEPAVAVRKYTLGHDLDYAIGLDPRAAVRDLYGGWGLPSHLFLDGNGTIRDRYLGQMNRQLMEEHLRTIIAS
jgi:thiol-disulfide isomerase/thioredoxin